MTQYFCKFRNFVKLNKSESAAFRIRPFQLENLVDIVAVNMIALTRP